MKLISIFNLKKFIISMIFGLLIISFFLLPANPVKGYGECSQYGILVTYDWLTNSCKCITGFVFGEDIFGNTTCISMDTWCRDKYGFLSTYNILTNSCKCGYGQVLGKDMFGKTACISGNSWCKNKYGYGSKYNSLNETCKCSSGYEMTKKTYRSGFECVSCSTKYGLWSTYDYLTDSCKCMSGYVLGKGIFGDSTCISGDQWCRDKYGIYSSYDSLSKKCECDNGYTLNNENECVEKQNNVYFFLKEIDTDEKLAIIKSEYDNRYYSITYGYGCLSSTIRRYVNRRIVVNLGTDFDVNRWDKIVLFDDNEICDIKKVERVYSNFTLESEEDEIVDYTFIRFSPKSIEPVKSLPKPIEPIKEELKSLCSEGYIFSNNKCITHNQDCQNTYGLNSKWVNNINKCICKDGYEWNNKETTCIKKKVQTCQEGYAPSLDKTRCIKVPKYAHTVDSATDVWLCDEGYKEIGNSCISFSEENSVIDLQENELSAQEETIILNKDNSSAQLSIKFVFPNLVKLFRKVLRWFST